MIDALVRAVPAGRPLAVANGDDCAVLPDGTAITVDLLCEGVHFDERLSPADLGYKAVAVSVSDLASMGAEPQRFVLALCHPAPDQAWVAAFAEGVGAASRDFGVDLIGGDTTRAAAISVCVTAFGHAPQPMRRDGAQVGDRLFLAGMLGLAAAGYRLADPPLQALEALRRPRPPVAFARQLAAKGWASAAMDASDGPARDLPRLAAASGVHIRLDRSALPVPDCLRGHEALRSLQLGGGDDYALLFTSAQAPEDLRALGRANDVEVHCVGEVLAGEGASCSDGPWPDDAWSHFGEVS